MYFGIYLSIYLYIYRYIWLKILVIFFVNPFELPYWSYDIRRELVDKSSIISQVLSAQHHQGSMYYKSDVTFVCKLLLCKN